MSVKVFDIQCMCPKCGSDFVDAFVMKDYTAELSDLRARVSDYDAARSEFGVLDGVSLVDWLREMMSEMSDAKESATLTPRRCGTCCTEAARKMREACVAVATEQEEWAHNKYISASDDDEKSRRQIQQDMAATISFQLENLPLPSCDGCNPLKTEDAS